MLDSDPNSFQALYPSAYRSVSEARHAAADFALDCGFDMSDLCDIALAVGEACNNAAEHGHVDAGRIRLGCVFDGVDLRIEISDNGLGFDVRRVLGVTGASSRERGMGIHIMRTLMDRVEYDCSGDGTTVRLIKRRRLG